MELAGKKVLVVGLGASGVAAVRLCLGAGALVRATDLNPASPGAAGLAGSGAAFSLGGHQASDFAWAELVVLSPGVDHRIPEVATARFAGAEVIGEMELGWRFLKRPAVMITGTNGKSTVTTLIGRMLAEEGLKVFEGGNLGSPLCGAVVGEQDFDWAVLEASSFQLDTAVRIAPRVGVVLNITPDHLDRYDAFEDYAASKMSLLARQKAEDFAVLCVDDPEVAARATGLPGRVLPYAAGPGLGILPAGHGGRVKGDRLELTMDGQPVFTLSAAASKLPGGFNRANLLGSAMAAWAAGAGPEAMQRAIDGFVGLAHRVQWVAQINGVDYYDDSKGTNVGAVIAAIEALARPQVLLLGGRDKEGRFYALGPQMNDLVKLAVCFGEAGPAIHEQVRHLGPVELVGDLASAVRLAAEQARPGWAVLLSPGCASFDAYGSYAQRGDHFQSLVKEAANG